MVAFLVPHQASFNSPIIIGSVGTPYTSGSNASSYTGTGLPTVGATERAVIAITGRNTVLRTLTSVTVGGEACAELHTADNNGTVAALYVGPLGASGNVEVTLSGSWLRCLIALWPCKNIRNSAASDTAQSTADPMNASIDCPAGGAIFGIAHNASSGNFSWTNLTEAFDTTVGTGSVGTGAANVFAGGATSRSITCNPSTANDFAVMALASIR